MLSSCDVTDVKQGRGRERWEEEERKRRAVAAVRRKSEQANESARRMVHAWLIQNRSPELYLSCT